MPAAAISLDTVNLLLKKSEGRDKLARLVQYAARAIVGYTGKAKAGTTLADLSGRARILMVQLAGARRTNRWCKEFAVIQTIPASLKLDNTIDVLFEIAQKLSLITFLVIDHVGWLKQTALFKGTSKRAGTGTIQLGLQWFCVSNAVAMIHQCRKLWQVSSKDADGKEREKQKKQRTHVEAIVKHSFLVVQTAHLSRVYETNDRLVGILGMITSCQDLFAPATWPQKA